MLTAKSFPWLTAGVFLGLLFAGVVLSIAASTIVWQLPLGALGLLSTVGVYKWRQRERA